MHLAKQKSHLIVVVVKNGKEGSEVTEGIAKLSSSLYRVMKICTYDT